MGVHQNGWPIMENLVENDDVEKPPNDFDELPTKNGDRPYSYNIRFSLRHVIERRCNRIKD